MVRAGCLMLGQVSHGTLDAYRDMLAQDNSQYGKESWGNISQADLRARLEQIERARRRGASLSDGSMTNGMLHIKEKLWEWAFREIAAKLTTMIEGDAPTSVNSSGKQSQTGNAPTLDWGAHSKKEAMAGPPKQHRTVDSGVFTHTRTHTNTQPPGRLDRAGLQQDQCAPAVHGKHPRNSGQVHKCSKCLSPLHGSINCNGARGRSQRRTGGTERWQQERPPLAVLSTGRCKRLGGHDRGARGTGVAESPSGPREAGTCRGAR